MPCPSSLFLHARTSQEAFCSTAAGLYQRICPDCIFLCRNIDDCSQFNKVCTPPLSDSTFGYYDPPQYLCLIFISFALTSDHCLNFASPRFLIILNLSLMVIYGPRLLFGVRVLHNPLYSVALFAPCAGFVHSVICHTLPVETVSAGTCSHSRSSTLAFQKVVKAKLSLKLGYLSRFIC